MLKLSAYIDFRIIILLITIPSICFCQKKQDALLTIWENTKLSDTLRANAYRDYIYDNYYDSKTDSAYAMTLNLLDFIEEHKLKKQKADVLILLGEIEHIFGDNTKATKNFEKSLKLYKDLNNKRGEARAISGLAVSFRKVFNLDEAKLYYEKSLAISKEIKDTTLISNALVGIGNIYAWRFKSDEALEYYKESLKLSQSIKDKHKEALGRINISNVLVQKKEFNEARKHLDEAIKIGLDLESYNILSHANNVISSIYFRQKDYDSLIISANKTLEYAQEISNRDMIDSAYYFLFEAYKGKRDFDLTIKYQNLRRQYRTTLDDISSVRTLEKIKIDNTRAKDSLININKTLLAGIAHQKEKTNLFLGWFGSFTILSVLAFIIYRNIKRKQKKAEKERQQQIDKNEKMLKNFELSTIDAMIQGQEKERQRLAADLHDSVGATLSAAMLQFNFFVKNQKDNKVSDDLIKKTSTLLEDAYVEIRSMSHLKNSGVMAKNGLLPAVEKLSKNASNINGLSIEVQSHGLEQRLENSLEISIFRIIQELVTNIIKHAKATKADVHLTNYGDKLNILVEDNGVGFNSKTILKTKSGMGINNIDRRVEHLDGTLTIESEKNIGTTVIIDIPL